MGRYRRRPGRGEHDGDVPDDDRDLPETIEARLGHHDQVCTDCNQRNDADASICRSCGGTSFRDVADEFRGKGSNNSGR